MYQEALGDFDAVLELDPDSAAALRGRGVALGSMGRNDEAVTELDRSLARDPDNGETLTARGLVRTSLGQHELAIEDYTRVIELDPGRTAVLHSRGMGHMRLGRYERGVQDFAPSSASTRTTRERTWPGVSLSPRWGSTGRRSGTSTGSSNSPRTTPWPTT